MIVLDGADDIPFHDLHVVNVVEEFEAFRADAPAKFHAPGSMITHVIVMIHLAVEQFHANRHVVLLGQADETFQTRRAVLRPSSSLIPLRLPEKQIRFGHPASAASGIVFSKNAAIWSWFSTRLESIGDIARHAADHGADQPVFFQHGQVVERENLHRLQPHLFGCSQRSSSGMFS